MSSSAVNFLKHILVEVNFIINETDELEFHEFITNDKDKRAISRSLEIIGEAIKNLPIEIRKTYPNVDWRSAAGLGDNLIHGYFNVDYDIIWAVVEDEIPKLKEQIETIIEDIEE